MMNSTKTGIISILISFILIQLGCTPPRSITQSGKVTPHKNFKVGIDLSANIPTHFVQSLYRNTEGIVNPLMKKDTVILNEKLLKLNETALAYAVEPLGFGYNYYIRYGVYKRFDLGYKYASGTHTIDGMYQFLGSTGTIDNPGEKGNHGSIGIQYSSKKYELPKWSGLNKVQNLIGFKMQRKDFLIPIVFSIPFGEEESLGNFSFGLVYSHTFLKYGFENENIYDTTYTQAPTNIQSIHDKKNYASFGAFFNFKIGYKYAYFLPAFALYYQDYGSFMLLDQSMIRFKGLTFVPSIGLQINPSQIASSIKKKKPNSKKN
ncbi:MAG: hypothetical protein H0V01_00130 [Bacteroidetes bacterium]|nr:hypothetical protein [Bacteroidota bacterium]HET6244926.1 hypothetical protein [Bacteroidia bacterium]